MGRKLLRRACPLAQFHDRRALYAHKHDRGHMVLGPRTVCYNCARRFRRICARAATRRLRAAAVRFRAAAEQIIQVDLFGDVAPQRHQPTLLDLWEGW
jgi:hypothetical protein